MGGAATRAASSVIQPWADSAAFFATDTVSGQVILRGYVEDDQRVERLDLNIGNQTITILEEDAASAQDGDTLNFKPPVTSLLKVPSALTGKVYFTDSLDLYRHRVEWAYIWDTESIPYASQSVTGTVSGAMVNDYGLVSNDYRRARQVTLAAAARPGAVLLSATAGGVMYPSANTGAERPTLNNRHYVQPWNTEYAIAVEGSELWNDCTSAHIWQSNDKSNGQDWGYFQSGRSDNVSAGNPDWVIMNPAMSVDPGTGTLWVSHNEGGSEFNTGSLFPRNDGNVGVTKGSRNNNRAIETISVFYDPMMHSDIYYSPGFANDSPNSNFWSAFSIIGRAGYGTAWTARVSDLGGVYIKGPGGEHINLNFSRL